MSTTLLSVVMQLSVVLGAVPGDIDQDADHDLLDFGWLQRCYTGPSDAPGFMPSPFPWCNEVFDIDANLAIDEVDYMRLGARSGLKSFSDYEFDGEAHCVAAGDLDGDGDSDFVIGSQSPSPTRMVVFRNRGNRVFEAEEHLWLGANQLELIDVDSDGDLDIIGLRNQGDELYVAENDGQGGFGAVAHYPFDYLFAFATGDIDGDQDVDIVFTPLFQGFRLLRNLGDGTFASETVLTGKTAAEIALSDIDGDGDLDVQCVAVIGFQRCVMVVSNNGAGTFEVVSEYPFSGLVYGFNVSDLDGDLKPDVAMVTSQPNLIRVLRGIGNGLLTSGGQVELVSVPYDLTVADIDLDGDMDLITPNSEQNTESIFLNRGDGWFASAITYDGGARPFQVTVADFDGDQRMDIVSANASGNRVGILFQEADGSFSGPRTYEIKYVGFLRATLADVDMDGIDDVVSAAAPHFFPGWGIVTVHAGTPDGEYVLHDLYESPFGGGGIFSTRTTAIATSDVDLDGDSDVVVGIGTTFKGPEGGIALLRNDGGGTLVGVEQHSTTFAPSEIRTADIDGDLDSDVLLVNGMEPTVQVWLSEGGHLVSGSDIYVDGLSQSFDVGDLDGDGDVDAAIARTTSNDVVTALRQANGHWELQEPFAVGERPTHVVLARVNGDDSLDVVTSNRDSMSISVLFNHGDGEIVGGLTIPLTLVPGRMAVADVDDDGDIDLMVSTGSTQGGPRGVSVFLQSAGGEFVPVETLPTGTSPSDLVTVDVRNDQDLDLVVVHGTAIEVLENVRFAP